MVVCMHSQYAQPNPQLLLTNPIVQDATLGEFTYLPHYLSQSCVNIAHPLKIELAKQMHPLYEAPSTMAADEQLWQWPYLGSISHANSLDGPLPFRRQRGGELHLAPLQDLRTRRK